MPAPGPPPRPGLSWKEETHRWVNIHTGEEHPHEAEKAHQPQAVPEQPREKAANKKELSDKDFVNQESFRAAWSSAVDVSGLPEKSAQLRRDAINSIVPRLTGKALARMSKSLNKIVGHYNAEALTDAWEEGEPKGTDSEYLVMGFVNRKSGEMHLDGGLSEDKSDTDEFGNHLDTRQGVYAHEIGHAIDMADGRWHLSFDPKFLVAFREEIEDGQLSDYATTSLQEGFAEFARMVYGTSIPHDVVEEKFQKTMAFFKSEGLI